MDPLIALLAELGFDVGEAQTIADLDADQVTAAEAALTAAYDEAREARDLDRCETIVDNLDAVRADQSRRDEEAAAAEARMAELDARVRAETTEAPTDDGGDEGDSGDGEGTEPAAPETPVVEDETPAAEPIAAAETPPATPIPPRRMPRAARPAAPPARNTVRAAITAAGGLSDIRPGAPIRTRQDMDRLANSVAQRIDQQRRTGAGTVPVAHVEYEFPSDRTLDGNVAANREKFDAVVASARMDSPEAIVAAGGLCAPVEVRYDVDGISDDRRPIRDALVRFGADRGGVRWVAPPFLSDLAEAVDVITEAEDAASASKPCLTISCGADLEEVVDAITKCLQVGNFQRRTFRENFDRYWQLAGAMHAREAETRLWDRMVAASQVVTGTQQLGMYRDFVENLVQLVTGIRSRDRTARDLTFRVIAPDWVVPEASIDLLRQMPGDQTYGVSEADLRASLAVHNIALTLTPDTDQEFPVQPNNNVLMGWPESVETLVFPEGTFAFLDGGELNFGMEIRDSTLNAANNVRSMTETFEGVAKFGVRSYHLTIPVCPDGTSSGTAEITPCGGARAS